MTTNSYGPFVRVDGHEGVASEYHGTDLLGFFVEEIHEVVPGERYHLYGRQVSPDLEEWSCPSIREAFRRAAAEVFLVEPEKCELVVGYSDEGGLDKDHQTRRLELVREVALLSGFEERGYCHLGSSIEVVVLPENFMGTDWTAEPFADAAELIIGTSSMRPSEEPAGLRPEGQFFVMIRTDPSLALRDMPDCVKAIGVEWVL